MRTFDITKHPPKVLLIGNGILRNENNRSWEDFLQAISKDDIDTKKYKNIPYTIQASAISHCEDKLRREKYENALNDFKYDRNTVVYKLLEMSFDAILTTNYTYELEYHLKEHYPDIKDKTYYAKTTSTDYNSLIYSYNRINNHDIWHIHGEQRRKSSIVLTHDEYARHTQKIGSYLREKNNYYQKSMNSIEIKSWIDYFVLGNLYILGFGFDFVEFDLWWLLSRRLREKHLLEKCFSMNLNSQTKQKKINAS